ncbi:MAG TPA: AraC family transcriptional regulator [Puia sp.]|nr:AraC family transcriptional regulator [Puia sp.]
MEFSLDPFHPIPLSGEVPIALRDFLLPVTYQHTAGAAKGFQFLLQEAAIPGIRLIYSIYKATRPIRLNLRDVIPFFVVAIALRHDRALNVEGLGSIRLKEGQFNALYAPQWVVQSLHQPGQESISLDIRYDDKAWAELAPYFPAVQEFLRKINAGQPAVLLEANGWITPDIHAGLYDLLHTNKIIPGFPLYFSLAARLTLFQLLERSQQHHPPSPYTNAGIDGIHAARDMIRDNIRRHFAIPEIAQRIGLNEFKLKTGFRELFGQGIYGYLQSVRMQEGARLLTETRLTIKEIADKTGYRSVNSFIKAFRKRFGVTPGGYRGRR